MKGIVFTEFLEMVEDRFGIDVAEAILDKADPASGGAYTSVGTYDFQELVQLVVALSGEVSTPVPDLLHAYGRHLFTRFVQGFPVFFEGVEDPLEFLSSVEDHIHVEVRKLYPDAELPKFENVRREADQLELEYRSPRPFGPFAEGLIQGCIEHFGAPLNVVSEDRSDAGQTVVRFTIG